MQQEMKKNLTTVNNVVCGTSDLHCEFISFCYGIDHLDSVDKQCKALLKLFLNPSSESCMKHSAICLKIHRKYSLKGLGWVIFPSVKY
jgi:hypothetical protein